MKHTKGKWGVAQITNGEGERWNEIATELNGCQISIAEILFGNYGMMKPDGKGDSEEYAKYRITKAEAEENARRIVACVNACEGISNEALESGVIRELLEACRGIEIVYAEYFALNPTNVKTMDIVMDMVAKSRRAIAKAEGK